MTTSGLTIGLRRIFDTLAALAGLALSPETLGRTNGDDELLGKAIALRSRLCVENACDSVPCMRSWAVQRSVVVVVVVVLEDCAG